MSEAPSVPQPEKQGLVESRKDPQGNLWFEFTRTPRRGTAIHGRRHATAVVTPQGMEFLSAEGMDKEDILRRVADNRLTTAFGKLGNTGHSVVKEVSSAKGQLDRLFSSGHATAVRKELVADERGAVKAKGWEMVELFDQIHPAFEEQGFQLLRLYGATDTQIFMPQLKGKKLLDVLLKIQDRGEQGGIKIGNQFKEQTKELYMKSLAGVKTYMEEQGFHIDPRWKWEMYHDDELSPPFSRDIDHVRVNLDFADEKFGYGRILGKVRGSVPRTFQNWIVEGEHVDDVVSLGEQGKVDEAVTLLKKHSVCYDPLYVVKLSSGDERYQEVTLNKQY